VPTPSYAAVRVETAVLNLRSAPDTSASLLGQTQANSVWRALAKLPDESWWQVCCVDRQRAWVSGQYVQPVGPAEALQQLPDLDPAATSSEWRGITLD
jgi:hypothetical protein